MAWAVVFVNEDVQAALERLPEDLQASFRRIVELIKSDGLERIREPYVKHLQGKLWEMRLRGRSGIARAVYVTAVGQRIVIVHVFEKKHRRPHGARWSLP